MMEYAGFTAPTGWLICDGRAVSRTTYATLYAVIGSTYGDGDHSTTFNLPDFRGRVAIGVGTGTGLSNRVLGEQVGEEKHTLTASEIPRHSHNISNVVAARGTYGYLPGPGNKGEGSWTTDVDGGGDQPHNVMQPSLVVNKIIKY